MTARAGNIVGALGVNIFPSFANFQDEFAEGLVNATTAKTAFIGTQMEKLGQAVFTRFTVPLGIATAANIAQFQALDREIRTTLTLFGTAPSRVDAAFGAMADGIREVSKEVGGLEKDIAGGLYQAISAGVPKDNVFEFLETAQMASMADRTADLTTAVDGLSTVVNAFGLSAESTGEIADVMFATVARGKTTFGELSTDIGRVAPLAANAGVAFQELFSIIGALTLQGLSTSESISFLRAGISGLLRPTEELNEIFQDLGFETAEVAIPVLGLQGAFQAVVDAADGSTSKLQELIGTSEGVSAILGVTGTNAETFASILGSIEQSAGSTNRAFEIMDDGVGRTFGRLTESFDRLGTTFGGLASELAGPVVEAITGVVDNLAGVFAKVGPYAKNAGEAVTGFMEVFNLPVIKEVVTALGAIALSVTGFIGIFGGASLVVGKFIIAASKTAFVAGAWKLLKPAIVGVSDATFVAGQRMQEFAVKAEASGKTMGPLAGIAKSTGKSLQFLSGGLLGQIAAATAIGFAIAGLFTLYSNWRDKIEEVRVENSLFTDQLDILAENLGLVNQAITLEGLEAGLGEMQGFTSENIILIRQLEEIQELLGNSALQASILTIGAQLVWKGNTPEQARAVIDQLADSTGIIIDAEINFSDPSANLDFVIAGLSARLKEINIDLRPLFAGMEAELVVLTGAAKGQITDLAGAVAEALAVGISQGEGDEVLDFIREIEASLPNEQAAAEFFNALTEGFAEVAGVDIGREIFRPAEISYDEFINRIKGNGFDITKEIRLHEIGPQIDEINEKGFLTNVRDGIATTSTAVSGAVELLEEETAAIEGFQAGINQALINGREHIMTVFNEIRTGFEEQIPLFEIYKGAIDLNFEEWEAGHLKFQEDLEAVADLRTGPIADMPEALQKAFDEASLNEQAWLTTLGEEDLLKALDIMKESLAATDLAGEDFFIAELPDIIAESNTLMLDEFNIMREDAREKGGEVEQAFYDMLNVAQLNWPLAITDALDAINGVIDGYGFSQIVIPGPVLGPATAVPSSGGSSGGSGSPQVGVPDGGAFSVTINNPTTNSLASDLEKFRAVLETSAITAGAS